jgi:Fe-S cluster biosynthesis and repair protein YggX
MVFCTRNKKEMEGLDEPPFDSEFGQKIYKNVSRAAWGEWVERQKMLLNEYRLQPWTPSAQQFLVEQMEESSSAPAERCRRSLWRRRTETGAVSS